MEHYGDITKISGYDVPCVDVITGGSPCQDLSVAGKREGLAGERSGLFMEQIRIIKEMRDGFSKELRGRGSDEYIRPRYMVWENVPGAFSSNKGEDFRTVLEETARVADKTAVIPRPPKGKWSNSGAVMGDGWSIAWRVHDAQFWGVPQRRKRIALVADFGGDTAPEILFERKSMSGNSAESGEARKGTTTDAEGSARETSKCLNSWDVQSKHIQPEEGIAEALYSGECRGGGGESYVMQSKVFGISSYDSNAMKSSNPHSGVYEADTARTLDLNGGSPACNQGGMAVVCLEGNGSRPSHRGDGYAETDTMYTLNSTEHHAVCIENHPADSRVKVSEDGIVQTLSSRMGTGGGNVPMVVNEVVALNDQGGSVMGVSKNITGALRAQEHGHQPIVFEPGAASRVGGHVYEDKAGTVRANAGDNQQAVVVSNDCYAIQGNCIDRADTAGCNGKGWREDKSYTLNTMDRHAVCVGNGQLAQAKLSEKVGTLNCMHDQQAVITYGLDRASYTQGKNAKFSFSIEEEKIGTQTANGPGAVCQSVVRRLTPLECERLQGYPDRWTDIGEWIDSKGKKHKDADSPRYKALGNSIALPFWEWMAKRMRPYLGSNPTMASLFDGIGGFPLVYSRCGIKPMWASEIEEFPIAVTKARIQ